MLGPKPYLSPYLERKDLDFPLLSTVSKTKVRYLASEDLRLKTSTKQLEPMNVFAFQPDYISHTMVYQNGRWLQNLFK